MEKWKHIIIYPPFFWGTVYATTFVPSTKHAAETEETHFLVHVFFGCFFWPIQEKHINLAELCSAENTQLGQDFNLIGNRFSIILFQRPKLELAWKKVFGDEFGSSWVLGEILFLWFTDLSLSYLLTSFFFRRFVRFWTEAVPPVFGHESSMGASLGGSFCWFSYHFLWSPIDKPLKFQLESESLHESCRASLEIWQSWKITTKMIPGTLTTSSSFGSSKKHGS